MQTVLRHDIKLPQLFTQFFRTMPTTLNYSEALQFAQYCYVADEFLNEYGSAIRWVNCKIDAGELMSFIDRIMGQ
jgi:hypothetical protein